MIEKSRDVDVCDLLVRQKDEPVIARHQPDPLLHRLDLEYVEMIPARRRDLDSDAQTFVLTHEVQSSLSELPFKERLIEH